MADTTQHQGTGRWLATRLRRLMGGITTAPGCSHLGMVFSALLVLSMASGIEAFLQQGYPAAIASATFVLWLTLRLRLAIRDGGWFQRAIYGAIVLGVISISVLLACAGSLVLIGSDRVARAEFEVSTRKIEPQIATVAAYYADVAGSASKLAEASRSLSAKEAHEGGSCGIVTPAVPGPKSRARGRDVEVFETVAKDALALSERARQARNAALKAKAEYTLAAHEATKTAFDEAQARAIEVARSSTLVSIRSTLQDRLNGGVDPQTGARVPCPRDPILANIVAVLKLGVPSIPVLAPAPEQPTHRNLVGAVARHFIGVLNGLPFDYETYGLALFGFLLDLAFHATLKLPPRAAPEDPITRSNRRLGIAGDGDAWAAFETAASNVEAHQPLRELRAMTVEVGPWRLQRLVAVPLSADGDAMRARMTLFVESGEATFLARGMAVKLLKGARFPNGGEDREIEVYRFTRSFWRALLRSAMIGFSGATKPLARAVND